MRGVAALIVVIYHFEGVFPATVPGGYLAVDLFFMLSGFVLAAVYLPRFERGMGVREFMISRVRRLYPFYLVGLALGFAALSYQDPLAALKSLPFGLVGLPAPGTSADQMFRLNNPYWSLFAEWAVNIAFVVFLWRLRTVPLAATATLGAAALIGAWWATGSLHDGAQWGDAWVGFARIAFSFPIGMLLHRAFLHFDLGRRRSRPHVLGLALPVLMLPCFFGLPDLLVVMLVFPALVLAGAALEPLWRRWPLRLGELSYPLYCVHMPLQIAIRFIAIRTAWPELVGLAGFIGVVTVTVMATYVAQRHARGARPIPATT